MRLGLVSLATVFALCGCATDKQLVTRHAANSTGCNKAAIEVTDLGQLYAGTGLYETSGCGIKHRYACPQLDNVVMASVGLINLDPRRCMQIKR